MNPSSLFPHRYPGVLAPFVEKSILSPLEAVLQFCQTNWPYVYGSVSVPFFLLRFICILPHCLDQCVFQSMNMIQLFILFRFFGFSHECFSFWCTDLSHLSSDLSKYLIFRCYYKWQCFYNFHFQVLIVYRYTIDSYILILYSVTLLNSLIVVFLYRQFHPIFSSSFRPLTAYSKSL